MRRLLRLQTYYGFFSTIHWLFLYFFLIVELEFPLVLVLGLAMFYYSVAGVFMVLLPRFESRRALRIGFLMRVLAILPFWAWPTLEGIVVASVFFGLAQPLFWIPYNLIFYEHRARGVNARTSAIAFAVQPFLDVAAALLAGLLVMLWGFTGLFFAAFVLGLVAWPTTLALHPGKAEKVEVFKRIRRLKKLRTLMFLDGVVQGSVWLGVAVVTIFFIDVAFQYALFFAFLAIIGAVAALILGPISDKRAKRFAFIWPLAFLFSLANFLSAFAGTLLIWGIARGAGTFLRLIYDPFKNAAYLDTVENVSDLYMAREVLLNIGRVAGIVVLLLAHLAGNIQLAFIVPALIGIAVPIIIWKGKLYPEERFVLKPLRTVMRQ